MIDQFVIADELGLRLSSARNEPSPIFARKLLKEIIAECDVKTKQGYDLTRYVVIGSNAFSELAQLENNIKRRKDYRRNAIRICKEQFIGSKQFDSILAINYADKAVNLFYDQFVREKKGILNAILADVKIVISRSLQTEENSEYKVQLLSQNSSVLRCQSQISSYKDSHRRSHEALRCSNKAVSEAPNNPNSYLSLGQSLWHVARRVSDDSKYFVFMNKAEEALIRAQTTHNPLSSLVLARFYRQTYRPSLAISTWFNYSNYENRNRRRLLAESFLAGEAALQLWYNNFESSSDALNKVVVVLREAVDSGYENSRIFMSLASVEAALGNIITSNSVLEKLYNGDFVDWRNIIEKAHDAINKDDIEYLEQSFAIGISDSSVWNALGTYSKTFLKDRNLAVNMYEIGRLLNPRNYILLTNLSRVLIEQGTPESLSLAGRYLSQAKNYSSKNKAFIWWRSVEESLKKAKGETKPKYLFEPSRKKLNFTNLYERFQFLLNGQADPHKRGTLFEILFYDLLSLSFGSEVIQGSHLVDVGGERQVDAAFKLLHNYYRVELKWHARPIGPDELDSFCTKLRTAEIRGLFVSMSGFTKGALANAHEIGKKHTIILMDGEDINSVFTGKNRFELVLEQKIDSFQRTGNPYTKQNGITQQLN